jgi:hypothetical protein
VSTSAPSRASRPTDRHPGAGPAPLVGQAASAAPQPLCVRSGGPGLPSILMPAMHCRHTTIPSREARFGRRRPRRSRTTATRRTRGAQTRAAPRHRRPGSSAVRTARTQRPQTPDACPSGHPECNGRGHRSPGHRTSARPVGRTPARRTENADRATNGVAGVRTSSTATTTATAGWTAQTSLELPRLRRSATDDGSAVTTPAAAVTGQHCLAWNRASAHCSRVFGVGGYEERATGRRKAEVCGVRLVRKC